MYISSFRPLSDRGPATKMHIDDHIDSNPHKMSTFAGGMGFGQMLTMLTWKVLGQPNVDGLTCDKAYVVTQCCLTSYYMSNP